MAVRHADVGLELQLLDYLLIAREATSVEITEAAKSLEPLDDTPFGVLDLRVLKLNRLCLMPWQWGSGSIQLGSS